MFNGIKNALKPVAVVSSKILAKTRANSPQAMFYGGMVVMSFGAIYGVYKAYKGSKEVTEQFNNGVAEVDDLYSTGDFKKEKFWAKTKVVGKTCLTVAKQQAVPAIIFGGGGVLACGGFKKLGGIAVMLSGLAAETKRELDDFYKRTSDQFGEEEAMKLRYGLQQEVKDIEHIDPSTGEKTKKKDIVYTPITDYAELVDNPFTYILSEDTMHPRYWSDSAFMNKQRLKHAKEIAEAELNEVGYIFLKDYLKLCGYKGRITEKEHRCGWIKKGLVPREDKNYRGDGFISDGVLDKVIKTEATMAFLEGVEPNVTINLNVDGDIVDYLNKYNLW